MNLPQMMMDAILAAGITRPESSKLVIQCFSFDGLKQFSKIMREKQYDIPLVLLRSCQDGLPEDSKLKELAGLSSNVGVGCDLWWLARPDTECLLPVGPPPCFVFGYAALSIRAVPGAPACSYGVSRPSIQHGQGMCRRGPPVLVVSGDFVPQLISTLLLLSTPLLSFECIAAFESMVL